MKIYFRWWQGNEEAAFTTLHLSREDAETFAQNKPSNWKTNPDDIVRELTISNDAHAKLVKILSKNEGVCALGYRGFADDIRKM
jgi:hypothetical protein